MRRIVLLVCAACWLAGCGGSASPVDPAPAATPEQEAPTPSSVLAQPRMPAVDGEVIGYPGTPAPGLRAVYVWTGLGWLGPDDDVVFEVVVQWDHDESLGCGIVRRGPDGQVNAVLMQGQPLPGTGGGRVRHPQLPLEAHGEMLVIPARVENGDIERGLFLAPKSGGDPVLLAGLQGGEFTKAVVTPDGTVIASVRDGDEHSVLVIEPGQAPREVCTGCEPGFFTDGTCIVVRKDRGAHEVSFDGIAKEILPAGAPAPGTSGTVTHVRQAWVASDGDFVVHALTDDPARPEALYRIHQRIELLAACGAPAPGTGGTFGELLPASRQGSDVVFAAMIDNGSVAQAIFSAPPDQPATLLAKTGDKAADLDATLAIDPRGVVAGGPGQVAFAAAILADSAVETGVFIRNNGLMRRVLTTDARLLPVQGGTLVGFLYPLREAIHAKPDGRTLVHIGVREDRQPDATWGALLLVR